MDEDGQIQRDVGHAPRWFGATARGRAFFPLLMSVYVVFYSVWWPFAWGPIGGALFAGALVYAAVFIVRGIRQIRHASQFVSEPTLEDARVERAMGILNSVAHPIWMIGSVVLLILGEGRWILPLMVFVIGAHFLPMASILGRKIDYFLGPLAMVLALLAGYFALNPSVSWLTVFAVAGVGGALSTGSYAAYMARAYRALCREAGVFFEKPIRKARR